MKIQVRVQTKSSQNKIIENNGIYKVYLNAPAENNRANDELIETLSEYFAVAKSMVTIEQGMHNKNKIINIQT
jgi:uncharacterized protein (TIGR00251 family)